MHALNNYEEKVDGLRLTINLAGPEKKKGPSVETD
jgi:hypothetical protein